MPIVATKHEFNGQPVQINIEMDKASWLQDDPYREVRGGPVERVVESARDAFGEGMNLVRYCAASMVETLEALGKAARPDEVELQLAVKLDAEAGAVLTKLGAEAQLEVTLKWTTSEKK
jgi:hypothetical protein